VNVYVLRIGHRFERDKRISTHLALTSRAFGAEKIFFDVKDSRVAESIGKITGGWGGDFKVEYSGKYAKTIREFEGDVIHLTMYGLPLDETLKKIKNSGKDKLVIVGGGKVPSEVYELADYNVSVGSQPHSEVAALAVFLDRLFEGKQFLKEFNGGKIIVPQARGKKVSEP